MYTLVISDAAEGMANDAYEWYEEQQSGAGDLFLSELEKAFAKLTITPLVYTKRNKNVGARYY